MGDEIQYTKENEIIIPKFNDVDAFDFETRPTGSLNPYQPGGAETIQIGTGYTVFNVDKQGMWMGDPRFRNAPFAVSMRGIVKATQFSNSDDQIIADEFGLNSLNTFVTDQVIQNQDQTFDDTAFIPSTGLVLTIQNVPRPAMALIFLNISGYHNQPDGRLEFQIYLNAQPVGSLISLNNNNDSPETKHIAIPVTLKSGENTIAVSGRSSDADYGILTGATIPAVLAYLLLGK